MPRSTSFLVVALLALASIALSGCAAAFRSSTAPVRFTTEPAAADVRVAGEVQGQTPTTVPVKRRGTADVLIRKQGYDDHRGVVKKRLNGGWVTVDIITCVFPVALCIPLLVDAISGAWQDVVPEYAAKLEPSSSAAPPSGTPGAPPPAVSGTPEAHLPPPADAPPQGALVPLTSPPASMSESERKATARAAFQEGVALQEKKPAEALTRFQAAQKLFDAPTHVLRIGQCLAAMGRLIEAQEVYEILSRRELPAGAPEAFRDAQEAGKKELEKVRARLPTLRLQIAPAPSSLSGLVVQLNGATMPNELVGIARPMNPGSYQITATATGMKAASVHLALEEGAQKTVELRLTR